VSNIRQGRGGEGRVHEFFWQILLRRVLGVVRISAGRVLNKLFEICCGVHEIPTSPSLPRCVSIIMFDISTLSQNSQIPHR